MPATSFAWPRRARGVALYLACWLPIAAIYSAALGVMTQGAMPLAAAASAAVLNLSAPAALGGVVWWASRRIPWPDARPTTFIVLHAAFATVFAAAWMGWELLLLGPTGPLRAPTYEMWRYVLPWQVLLGYLFYGVIAGVSYAVRGMLGARDLRLTAERAERLRAQAELAALRAHINPHFLFNTLHAVMQLQREGGAAAEESLERLADLFAYVLRLERHRVEVVALEDDWHFAESYLWLERMRLGPRLRVESAIDDDALSCAVPPFTLQPLVENAVRHGIAPKRDGGTVWVRARERDGRLEIEVADDGIGAEPERPDDDPGLGERAVSRRLAARHRDLATATVETAPGQGYRVRLSLPAEPAPVAAGATA
jgi:signal transduction histidine kinase